MHDDETRDDSVDQDTAGRARTIRFVVSIVVVGSVAPVLLYWLFVGRIPTVTPKEARQLLHEPKSVAALVDVREPDVFSAGHIDGAVNWPLSEILQAQDLNDTPKSLDNKTMLLISDVGMASRQAARHLRLAYVPRIHNVRGGTQEWMRSFAEEISAKYYPKPTDFPKAFTRADPPPGDLFDRVRIGPMQTKEFPFRVSSVAMQLTAFLAYFVIKPVYTLLALAVAVLLWKRREADLVALRWSMISFFLGENACAINYGFFRETSYLFEYLHSFGMLCSFSFFVYALLEGVDRRILRLSDPGQRCAALGLCTQCIKHTHVPCGLKRMFLLFIPLLILVALMVPTADWQDGSYNTYILGQFYHYSHLRVFQQYENWYCPAAAVVCLTMSLGMLLVPRADAVARAKIPFAAGVGALTFGMLRMVLSGAYDQDRVWFLFWEEFTEFLFIVAVCASLGIFRQGLLRTHAKHPSFLQATHESVPI